MRQMCSVKNKQREKHSFGCAHTGVCSAVAPAAVVVETVALALALDTVVAVSVDEAVVGTGLVLHVAAVAGLE